MTRNLLVTSNQYAIMKKAYRHSYLFLKTTYEFIEYLLVITRLEATMLKCLNCISVQP